MLRRTSLSIIVVLALTGCGGGTADMQAHGPRFVQNEDTHHHEDNTPVTTRVHAHGDHEATVRVGSLGGELELGNGATLLIPAGALAQPVEVVFRLGPATNAFNNHDYEEEVGDPLIVAPELVSANGQKFVVTLPFAALPQGFTERSNAAVAIEDADTRSAGFEGGATRTRWDHEDAEMNGHAIHCAVTRLPGLRLQFVVER